ncbi:MAG: DUF4424 domain-containing protein [Hyphomicrobiales bacterium]|nr:DUF4424 domain-containing protein [Hyphomicrobiales bacterium]
MTNSTMTAAVAALALWLATPALANDSTAEIAIGGLSLTKSDVIVMQSEDLFVSEAKVSVDYVFLNASSADVETLVAFPLPDIENGVEAPVPDYAKDLAFRTTVDGKPVELALVQRAIFKGADVTERLAALGLEAAPVYDRFDPAVNRLAPDVRQKLVADGLIEEEGSDGKQTLWTAHWTTRTTVTRTQVFPAGRPVKVSHVYKPLAGGSVGGMLEKRFRTDPEYAAEAHARQTRYCLDADFLRAFDALARKDPHAIRTETWLGYVLTSGANWKGPIRDFRLVVDKGDPKNLVSFCATGVKKIAPTRFEVRYKDFTPKQDLNVLIVKTVKND